MNSVNRAMGTRDLYPFVLSPRVLIKLEFIHQLIHDRARAARNREPLQHEEAVLKQSILPEEGSKSSEVATIG
jgi:Putative zinc-binding metallo-peptidase